MENIWHNPTGTFFLGHPLYLTPIHVYTQWILLSVTHLWMRNYKHITLLSDRGQQKGVISKPRRKNTFSLLEM